MTEADAIDKICNHWGRCLVFPNIYCCGGEMDVAVVTKARFLWEVEIKLSLGDWRADAAKQKWNSPNRFRVARMFYAVPGDLIAKEPSFVPDDTGLIALTPYVQIVRPAAPRAEAPRVTDVQLINMLKSTHNRFWQERRMRLRREKRHDR